MFSTAYALPNTAARGKDQLLRPVALLLLAAACGLTHNHLQLLPGAAAQADQPGGDLPPATAAMRYLEGYWQGTMSYSTEDGRTASRCVQQIVMRNGSLWQVRMGIADELCGQTHAYQRPPVNSSLSLQHGV